VSFTGIPGSVTLHTIASRIELRMFWLSRIGRPHWTTNRPHRRVRPTSRFAGLHSLCVDIRIVRIRYGCSMDRRNYMENAFHSVQFQSCDLGARGKLFLSTKCKGFIVVEILTLIIDRPHVSSYKTELFTLKMMSTTNVQLD
jgi:hypothetical protein